MVRIKTVNIVKRFGNFVALRGVSLEIKDGEFFTILGPSGCGKTTFLRSIAGFERVDEGKIFFDDEDVTYLPPHKRNTGMVFQNYALWPHMTVYDNIAYGLKVRKVPKEEIDKRVKEVLKMVHLEGMEKRTPHQLSGGQQQRVALARALVINPRVLLLDEPLSNLDAKLRLEMRAELKRLQKQLGITTIYVTHDQEEAMSISDRLAVMDIGVVKQVGTPEDIYNRPSDAFVANFIGQGTFIKGNVLEIHDDKMLIELESGLGKVYAVPSDPTNAPKEGETVLVTIRPENFELGSRKDMNNFEIDVYHVSFLGSKKRVQAEANGIKFLVDVDPDAVVSAGSRVKVWVDPRYTLAIRIS
jgi:spermidine/putrescine ABC transporter ATP-binding subunit